MSAHSSSFLSAERSHDRSLQQLSQVQRGGETLPKVGPARPCDLSTMTNELPKERLPLRRSNTMKDILVLVSAY